MSLTGDSAQDPDETMLTNRTVRKGSTVSVERNARTQGSYLPEEK